jgi:urease beta subunit
MIPGEYILKKEDIELNKGRETLELVVKNTSKRPIQLGSHFHFFEVNKTLVFDRKKAFGKRLDIPSGTAIRFEPGEKKNVRLVSLGGRRFVYGLNGLLNGSVLTEKGYKEAIFKAKEKGFKEV